MTGKKETKADRWNFLRERLFELPNNKFVRIVCDLLAWSGDSFTWQDIKNLERIMKEEGVL